jgi:hypothetical protein
MRGLKWGLELAIVAVGAWLAWKHRHAMNPDGVSYLDAADAWLRGDWLRAVTGVWSPLYSWLLAAVLWIAKPAMWREYPVVHLLNGMIFLGALRAFGYFLLRLIESRPATAGAVPDWVVLVSGYAVFLWGHTVLIPVEVVAPDTLLAALVYLIHGWLLTWERRRPRLAASSNGAGRDARAPRLAPRLGLLLGAGYLAKAVMLPLAPLYLALAMRRTRRPRWPRVLLAAVYFALVAAPYIVVMSSVKGRVTFSDAGRLNYAWFVNRVTPRHWQGEGNAGVPLHPTRRICESPPVYEFGGVFDATYPLWYDPSYWYEGVEARFDAGAQTHALGVGLLNYAQMLSDYGLSLLLVFGLLLASRAQQGRLAWGIVARAPIWPICMVSLAAMGLYALVHVEPRYVAPFVASLLTVTIASLEWPATRGGRSRLLIGMSLVFVLTAGPNLVRAMNRAASRPPFEVAEHALRAGLKPGDRIASLEYSNLHTVQWARLARARIVAELFDKPGIRLEDPRDVTAFWQSDGETKRRVMDAFRRAGAVAVVASRLPREVTPAGAQAAGWRELGQTGVYLYFLYGN